MDKPDNRDISQQWDDLLKDAFGSTETPIAIDTDAEPVKDYPTMIPSAQEEPAVTAPAPEVPVKRPLYRRFWFWLILIALAAGLGIAAWFFLGKDADTEPLTPEEIRMQEALALCKDALAQWQAKETYYMTQNNLYYGDALGGATHGEFWVSGNDIVQIYYYGSMDYIAGALKYDGSRYSAESTIHPATGIPEKNRWTLLNENDQTAPTLPWPMSFEWDAHEIVGTSFVSTSGHGNRTRFTSVSFSILRSDSAPGALCPSHVNFTFDIHSNLESVTIVAVAPGEAEQTSMIVITYRLGTTDYDIAQFIAEAPSQPLTFVLSNSPVPLPE